MIAYKVNKRTHFEVEKLEYTKENNSRFFLSNGSHFLKGNSEIKFFYSFEDAKKYSINSLENYLDQLRKRKKLIESKIMKAKNLKMESVQ